MNKIGKRLQVIASLVDTKNVADVGCDHGKLVEYLFDRKIIESAIISDISRPSLDKAIKLLSAKNYPYTAICCDGLSGYKVGNLDTCIISGMGGFEICKILDKTSINIDNLILSPQQNIIETKKFLIDKNYQIVFDIIVEEKGKFYNIFKCKKSDEKINLSDYRLQFGLDNFTNKNSDIKKFLDAKLSKFYAIQASLETSNEKLKIK